MPTYHAGYQDRITFASFGFTDLELPAEFCYVTEIHGVRLAVVQFLYDRDDDHKIRKLLHGKIGRFTITHPELIEPRVDIPTGVVQVIGSISEAKSAYRYFLVVTEVHL
jgi:hypothetical protein